MKISKVDYAGALKNDNYNKNYFQKVKNSTNSNNSIKSLNAYQPVSFTRKWSEHKSWGAVIDPDTKEVKFKLFSYPDNKSVEVEVKNKDNNSTHTFPMQDKGKGVYESEKISPKYAKHGDSYSYIITDKEGNKKRVKDPYSFRQKELLGSSVLYDHSLFDWQDEYWYKINRNRVSHIAGRTNGLTPVNDLRIYELNIGTFSQDGDFKSAKKVLKKIRNQGFNAIELMPVENTYSFNWGYDGVDKFAPGEHLGGPDQLKELINYAHQTGLNVIMDMVPNHVGPDGNSLKDAGPYIKGPNTFGDGINYEGENSEYVRDWMINAALNWIDNYHCDGLRLDMTKFMESDFTMKQIAAEINYHKPDAFLIAEDGRGGIKVFKNGEYKDSPSSIHDMRVINPLEGYEFGQYQDEEGHSEAIDKIIQGDSSLARLGYDSEWDFPLFHQLKEALYGNVDGWALSKAMMKSGARVKYVMSHDEIGNYEGTRLMPKLMTQTLNLQQNIRLNKKDLKRAEQMANMKGKSIDEARHVVLCQKAQLTSDKLLKMFLTGKLDKYERCKDEDYWNYPVDKNFVSEVLEPLDINPNSGIRPERIEEMYISAFNKVKMAMAQLYAVPGPVMVFQGDEKTDLTPFRFFREFQSDPDDEKKLFIEKGYSTGLKGFRESKINQINYSEFAKDKMNKYQKLMTDLNILTAQNPALTRGKTEKHQDATQYFNSKVITLHSCDKESGNEIYSIANFENVSYPRAGVGKYYVNFPEGLWQEVINTDDKKYGGKNRINPAPIQGGEKQPICLGKNSTAIFRKIG